eukprot:6485227-Amphidinium_carterae.1
MGGEPPLDAEPTLDQFRFQGLHLMANGELMRTELYGPENHSQWLRCYRVLRTTLTMLGEVEPSAIDSYSDHITELVRRYGDGCWGLIYQADVHCRRELMLRLRRKGEEEKDMNAGHPFDPDSGVQGNGSLER